MQLFGDLHWLKSYAGSGFLFEDTAGWVLVDTGMWGLVDPVKYLAKRGIAASAITHILITHADVDHISGLESIQKQTGATVVIGSESLAHVRAATFPKHNRSYIDNLAPRFVRTQPLTTDKVIEVSDGETLPLMGGLQVIATPGHTADHFSFYSPVHGILFAGDAINRFGGTLQCSQRFISADYSLAKQSALKLAALAPAMFACGHGTPYLHSFEDLDALFANLRR
ncbi:MAG: MBL fold metallo-hydrolase [Candidatus Promineifilaceae bacterium]